MRGAGSTAREAVRRYSNKRRDDPRTKPERGVGDGVEARRRQCHVLKRRHGPGRPAGKTLTRWTIRDGTGTRRFGGRGSTTPESRWWTKRDVCRNRSVSGGGRSPTRGCSKSPATTTLTNDVADQRRWPTIECGSRARSNGTLKCSGRRPSISIDSAGTLEIKATTEAQRPDASLSDVSVEDSNLLQVEEGADLLALRLPPAHQHKRRRLRTPPSPRQPPRTPLGTGEIDFKRPTAGTPSALPPSEHDCVRQRRRQGRRKRTWAEQCRKRRAGPSGPAREPRSGRRITAAGGTAARQKHREIAVERRGKSVGLCLQAIAEFGRLDPVGLVKSTMPEFAGGIRHSPAWEESHWDRRDRRARFG